MRVLFLTNIPAPYRVDFFNELGKYCDLTVLYERKNASDRNENWIGNRSENFKEIFLKGINVKKEAAFCPSVVEWLDKASFDIFVVGGYSTPTGMLAIQTLKMKKIPFFLNGDGGSVKADSPIIGKVKRHFIGGANWWLTTGNESKKYLVHYKAKESHIFTYPFTTQFKKEIHSDISTTGEKEALRKELKLNGKKIVLSVGQFIHRKGFELLINNWKKLPHEYQLVIVGGGPDKDDYLKLIQEKKLFNVKIEDFKSKKELEKYYRAADLFVLPTMEDIWGLVVNEAMACGLPVISTNKCVAALELIQAGKNGYVVPVNSPQQMMEKIDQICGSEQMIADMGRESLRQILPYTIENMAKEHIDIFNSILNK